MTDSSYARSIELPTDQIFRNLKNAKRFAIDIGVWNLYYRPSSPPNFADRFFQTVRNVQLNHGTVGKIVMLLIWSRVLEIIALGGSLVKLAYYSTVPQKRFSIVETSKVSVGGMFRKIHCSSLFTHFPSAVIFVFCSQSNGEEIYRVSEEDVVREQLHFIKFETKYIETCLDFVKQNLIGSKEFMRVSARDSFMNLGFLFVSILALDSRHKTPLLTRLLCRKK